jgi:hypothetical protein
MLFAQFIRDIMTFYDVIGLSGVSLTLLCYARVQWQRDYAKKLSYSALNFASALLLAISLLKNWNLASFVCNGMWGFISLYGIYRCTKHQRRSRANL